MRGETKMSDTKHTSIGVTGMTCSDCSSRVEKVLNKMDGVDAQVNLMTETATIDYDPSATSVDAIAERIDKLGYGVEMEKVELDVFGMTCATCSTRIEKMLNKQEGVGRATVNLANETAVIEYSPGVLTDTELTDKIKAF